MRSIEESPITLRELVAALDGDIDGRLLNSAILIGVANCGDIQPDSRILFVEDDGQPPSGWIYFPEIDVMREVADYWRGATVLTVDQLVEKIVHYARFDSFE